MFLERISQQEEERAKLLSSRITNWLNLNTKPKWIRYQELDKDALVLFQLQLHHQEPLKLSALAIANQSTLKEHWKDSEAQ